jgi:hypothetical protein
MKNDAGQYLGKAAIESNISYHEALEDKYKTRYLEHQRQREHWQAELNKLKITTTKKHQPASDSGG